MKLENIKTALANLLFELEVKMGKMLTDKGILSYEGEELMVDMEVKIVNEDGTESPVEDGEYITENETTITIKDGKVVSIAEKEMEVEPETPVEEETPIEEEPIEAEEEPIEEEETPIKEEPIEEKPNEVEILRGEIEVLTARIEALEKLIEELNGKPVDKPAEEQFEVIKKREQTPLKGKERANSLIRLAKK